MTGHEIRQKFLSYFEQNGHRIVKSSPLLLPNDPTLLFANAGMNQFKNVFLGQEKRDYSRATTSQKCVRAGGKHNDLDEVGRTARHHTFFEMLGNFSFGDYFKEDAIRYAWDLIVNVFGLEKERLWFTVYNDDDEAAELWQKIGAPADRVLRFGEKDNFWEMGETGPCGPCSEIHYFMGEDMSKNTKDLVNGPGDDTMEIWNLVFMQFDRDASRKLTPLPKPSVDTGMGLERISAILQGVKSNYETDLIRPIIDFTSKLCGKPYEYESENGFSMRVIADHARATTFLIGDGIFPGNDGRAYVLRKIMRRALWHGHKLGLQSPFFHKVTEFVAQYMSVAYPDLLDNSRTLERAVMNEDKLFASTLSGGIKRLEEIMGRTEGKMIAGKDAFTLYDTYGLREDLISYIAEQSGYEVDWAGFQTEMEEQKKRARESWKGAAAKQVKDVYQKLSERGRSEFTGYAETVTSGARVVAIVVADEERQVLGKGDAGEVVLDRTPFYAESGGQIGDTGIIESDTARVRVNDCFTMVGGVYLHKVTGELGSLKVGDVVTATVDAERRDRIRANHTGTHLLHAALRDVLGPHVKQAGSLVAPDRLRFDFTHFMALSPEEIAEIERLVNTEILKNIQVHTDLMELDEAVKTGAMALFGEKYAEKVRVVSVPGFSRELCGGTHTKATGDIGMLKIVSDSSIAAGVRRLEALTGQGAYERFQHDEQVLTQVAQALNATPDKVPEQIDKLQQQLRAAQRELESLKLKLASAASGDAAAAARQIDGFKVVAQRVENLDASARRTLADDLMNKIKSGAVVIGQADADKASLLVRVSPDLTKKIHAGQVVNKLAAIVGGKGGGRPDLAEAGGKEAARLGDALEASYQIIEQMASAN